MSKIFRLFILSLCLLSLQLNCFAGNILQQEYETAKIQELAQEPTLHNMSKRGLIEDDYLGYLMVKTLYMV